ncbi:hypothetical protein KZ770_08730 [Escherichia coli]|nr:hypothetical protein [Escherichia coli]
MSNATTFGLRVIETEQTIPEQKDNSTRRVKNTQEQRMDLKNDMDNEKSQKGKGSTEHSNKTPETQPERFPVMQINNNPKNLQLNHTTQSRMRMTRLKPVYR